jgi:hypothetical protein
MGRVAPSVIARQQLQELLAGGADRGSNIISALVETVTRLVVQELLEGEQADYLGGRGRYERRGEGQVGSRNGLCAGSDAYRGGPCCIRRPTKTVGDQLLTTAPAAVVRPCTVKRCIWAACWHPVRRRPSGTWSVPG